MTAAVSDIAIERLARLRDLAAQCTTEAEALEVAAAIRTWTRRLRASRWNAYPWQRPHQHPPGWVSLRAPNLRDDLQPSAGVCDERCYDLPLAVPDVHQAWVQRGGRGTGKTEGAAHYVNAHVDGPPCDPRVPGGHRLTIAAPTQPDAVTSCVTGVSGLQSINPSITVATTKEGTLVRWPNGAVAKVLGAHDRADVERARAWTNVCLWWLEEAAAMNWLGGLSVEGEEPGMLDQAPFTLRLGERPHLVVTTTPRARPEVDRMIALWPVQTWGRTEDADRLPAPVRSSYEALFPRGTTMARQELDGERVTDVRGALWLQRRTAEHDLAGDDRPGIDNDRVPEGSVGWTPHTDVFTLVAQSPETQATLDRLRALLPAIPTEPTTTVTRTAVGVDPAGGSTENGIVVMGTHLDHGYTLGDFSLTGPPATWGIAAVLAWQHYGAEGIAVERTYGGDQTWAPIETACRELGLPIPARLRAPTVEGKKQRAIALQALSQVHRLHHVGHYAALEGEQTTWVEDESESPNRLDAWVHAGRHLLVRARTGTTVRPKGRSLPTTGSSWGGGRTSR